MVDIGLAKASNDLIMGGIVAYSLGLLGYAADCAYGNHAATSQPEAVAGSRPAARPAILMVAAALPTASSAMYDPAVVEGWDVAPLPIIEQPSGVLPGRKLGRVAVGLTLVGWVLHGGSILTRGLAVHRLPWGNMYEFALALTFAAVGAFLLTLTRQRVRFLGVFVMTPVLLGLGLAVTVLYVPPAPLVPALQSYWLAIHVTAAIVASGVFTVGTAATVMFLIADSYATAIAVGKTVRFSALARILPAPSVLDRTAYRAYLFAFPLWTFAVVAGAIWAEASWGHYWQWDPKETWSFITWVVYAGYLHARSTAGWRHRGAAYIAVIGFVTFLFNFFGVNMVLVGMHSYAGV